MDALSRVNACALERASELSKLQLHVDSFVLVQHILSVFRCPSLQQLGIPHPHAVPFLHYMDSVSAKVDAYLQYTLTMQSITTLADLHRQLVTMLKSYQIVPFTANPEELSLDDDAEQGDVPRNDNAVTAYEAYLVGSLKCHPRLAHYFRGCRAVKCSVSWEQDLSLHFFEWQQTDLSETFFDYLGNQCDLDPPSNGIIINQFLIQGETAVVMKHARKVAEKRKMEDRLAQEQWMRDQAAKVRLVSAAEYADDAEHDASQQQNLSTEASDPNCNDDDQHPQEEHLDPKSLRIKMKHPTHNKHAASFLDSLANVFDSPWSQSFTKVNKATKNMFASSKQTPELTNQLVEIATEYAFLHMGKSKDRAKRFAYAKVYDPEASTMHVSTEEEEAGQRGEELPAVPQITVMRKPAERAPEVLKLGAWVSAADLQGCAPNHVGGRVNDQRAVGRWGEALVYQFCLKRFGHDYDVEWLNEEQESKSFYDIKISSRNPNAVRATAFIEVKATRFPDKHLFETSLWEFEFMKSVHDTNVHYYIFRVYSAGDGGNAKIRVVHNPMKLLKEQHADLLVRLNR